MTCFDGRWNQPHDRPREHRLSRTGFANNTKDFATLEREGSTLDDLQCAIANTQAYIVDFEQGCGSHERFLMRGSRRSRNASPRRLIPSSDSEIARPGKIPSQTACSMKLRLPASILPHVGAGGGTPSPRKLSELSARIAQPHMDVAMTRTGARQLGRI